MKLPKPGEIIEPKEINPKFLLLYGSPKVGKTSIIELIKEPYLLVELDPHGAAYFKGTYIEINSLDELQELIDEVGRQGNPYKYIIIDTITKLAEWIDDYATAMYKQSNLGKNFKGQNAVVELAKGAGYYWQRRAFALWFNDLKTLADRIIFIGHVKDSALTTVTKDQMGNEIQVEKVGVDEVSSLNLNLPGQLKHIVSSQVDSMGYIYRKTVGIDKDTKKPISQLRVNFSAGSSILGGSRPHHLRGVDMEFDWEKIYLKEEVS
jgi:hypothetical protein